MNCVELFDVLKEDQKLKAYLPIIADFPKYPVFYDSSNQVLSLPPIINSDTTKISQSTKNVLIEVTGTDWTKCKIVLSILSAQFSHHCKGDMQFKIEPVEIIYEGQDKKVVEPKLDYDTFEVETKYITQRLGIELSMDQIAKGA